MQRELSPRSFASRRRFLGSAGAATAALDDETHQASASAPTEHVAAPIGVDEATQALRDGPIGAFVVASIATLIVTDGWQP
jgi:hypothetical protein